MKEKQEIIRLAGYLRIKSKEYEFNNILRYLSIFGVVFPLPFFIASSNISIIPPHPSILASVLFAILYKVYSKKQEQIDLLISEKFSEIIESNSIDIETGLMENFFDKLTPKKKKKYKEMTLLFNVPRLLRKKGKLNLIEEAQLALATEYIKIEKEKSL